MRPEGVRAKSDNASINIRPYTIFYFIAINKNISLAPPVTNIVKFAFSSVSLH